MEASASGPWADANRRDATAMVRQIHVVGAVIISGCNVLCVQRGPDGPLPLMWEFPGGKIEAGETPQAALKREIYEELLCEVAVGDEVTTTSYKYEFGVVHLTTFYCELVHGSPQLVEHAALKWSDARELRSLEWAPADIPAIEIIMQRLGPAQTSN
ncbi:(deoxy)nucleoside triphosphate pyrophosphohydrolase [Nocardioides sp. S-58]|uniref:8-oxo-dGTP diphosphatase n=1 Tax=Nocardioides renjunii TaxID=3095075 RepID=A0ABU5K867_9ACTN|nr:(deoxy)nucleoside triphosphate pyrophosphohydrolase [Nocardioides sp. S-58]MDZ5660669.1 (deoxy)nucleoside triphosphate pyrophosphohydrolase [Nocardioides sp. S-58]